MPLQTHLLRRGAVYYFRAKVPVDLQPFLGKREEKYSLKTKDPKEARSRARKASAEFDEKCERLRAQIEAQTQDHPAQPITDELIEHLCTLWRNQLLEGDERARLEGDSLEEQLEQREERENTAGAMKETLGFAQVEAVEPALEVFLMMNGLRVSREEPDRYRLLLYRFLQTLNETQAQQIARDRGEVVRTPSLSLPSVPSAPQGPRVTFKEAFEDWQRANPARDEGSVLEVKRAIGEFEKLTQKTQMSAVTRKDIISYRDHCIGAGGAAATVRKKVGALRALYNIEIDNGTLTQNPARRVTIPKGEEEDRLPFDIDDLKRIFGSPLYTEGVRLGRDTGEAGVWVPLLALYHGCRIEELAALLSTDIQHVDGIYLINIEGKKPKPKRQNKTDAKGNEAKRVKNRPSNRRIPLHPVLIKAGFLNYVQAVKKAGHTRLFHTLKADRRGRYAPVLSEQFLRYIRKELGVEDPKKVFHSFRHTFRTACRNGGIDEEMADALMGHSSSKQGRNYGAGFSLQRMREAICRIEYPGLRITAPVPAAVEGAEVSET